VGVGAEVREYSAPVFRRVAPDLLRLAFPDDYEDAGSILSEVVEAGGSVGERSLLELLRTSGINLGVYYRMLAFDFMRRRAVGAGATVTVTEKGLVAYERFREGIGGGPDQELRG